HWYQTSEILDAVPLIAEIAKGYRRVTTYGSSMGGYAAIKFAPAMGAAATIAISPQYSIHPEKAPFETRFTDHFKPEKWTNDEFDGAHANVSNFTFFDQFDDDGKHGKLLMQHVANIIPVRIPFAGHPGGMLLNDMGLLGPSALAIIDG